MSNLIRRLAGRPARITALCTAALLSAATLTACGGGNGAGASGSKQGDIATLSSSAPAEPTTAADAGRPQMRLDMTEDEKSQILETYRICLKDHGVKVNQGSRPGPVGSGKGLDLDDSGEPKAAYTACANKLPLLPPELDPAKNPDFPQQWNENVKCLRARGLKVHVTEPGEYTWDADSPVPDPAMEKKAERECELEVFGGKKK